MSANKSTNKSSFFNLLNKAIKPPVSKDGKTSATPKSADYRKKLIYVRL